jgi:catechol 2,3-dioxygenase-like lactoylglutathione lyase family enzyme
VFHDLKSAVMRLLDSVSSGVRMIALADFAVTVTDAKATARWWQEKLGFGVHTVGQPGGHAIMVAPPGERFLIHLCEGFEGVEPGNTGIAFMTDDIHGTVQHMEAGGVTFVDPLKIEDWGGSAKFADPDGNVFWLLGASSDFIRDEISRRAVAPTATQVKPSATKGRPKRRS